MATSGSKSVAVTNYTTLKFSWELASQSVADNTSTVSWKLQLIAGSSGRISSTADKDYTIKVNGTTYSGTNKIGIENNATKTLKSGSTVIAHNADGSKTFSYSFKQEIGITLTNSGEKIGTKSGSGSGTLPTIARASQPSCVTWPEHTQNVGEFGDTISIHMNRASDVFTHTVRYAFGDRTGTIATGVGTGMTWQIPESFMELLPSSTSGSGTIYVDTYHGDTFIGTKSCGFTATVPASVKPICTFTLDDITTADQLYGSPVKGLSKIKIDVVPGITLYPSPIVAYTISANGEFFTEAEATTGVLKTAGTSRVTATITDARGRTGTKSYDMTVLDYVEPAVTKLTVQRCNEDGSANDQGEYVKATFSATITSLNSKNSSAYTLRYKKSSATEWTSVDLGIQAKTYTVTDKSAIFPADGNSSYNVEVTAADRHNSSSRATSVSTAFTLMNWGADGTSMGIGKVAEDANTLGIALHTEIQGNRYAASSPGIAGTEGFVLMAQVKITAENADTPITFVFSRRQEIAPMTVHLRLRNSTMDGSTLETIRYEGANYGVYAYSPDPLTWNIYVLKGSNYDTITLQDWYTSKSMNSRVKVTFPGTLVDEVPLPYYRATPAVLDSILDAFMPVGFVLTLYSHADPNTMYPGTTWVRIQNAFLWAVDGDGDIGTTGGSKTHTLTVDELPSHSHGSVYSQHAEGTKNRAWYSTSGTSMAYGAVETGGGAAHNNMPPYVQVSIWRRTA